MEQRRLHIIMTKNNCVLLLLKFVDLPGQLSLDIYLRLRHYMAKLGFHFFQKRIETHFKYSIQI